MAEILPSPKSKTLASTQRARRRSGGSFATTTTSTSLETPPVHAMVSPEQSLPPDSHVSGSSLGTTSFSLASLLKELESLDDEIWGKDPTDPDELSDDPDGLSDHPDT